MKYKKHSNKSKSDFLYQFIEKTLKDDPENFISETFNVEGKGDATELKTCIKEKGILLIPGSTMKGAIKSAMLYNWLMQDKQEKIIAKILNDLKLLYNSADNESRKEIKKEKSISTKIANLLDQFLEKMDKDNRLNFSLFKIEDAYFENEIPIWIHTLRYPLKYKENKEEEKKEIPIFLEAIQKGAKSSFSIEFESNQADCNLTEYFKDSGIYTLVKHINRYSKENLQYEQTCVQRKNELVGYLNELYSLEEQIDQSDENAAFIPVGFGKTNFYQSIGLALWNWINRLKKDEDDYLKNAFENYLRLFKIGRKIDNTWQKQMPLTRILSEYNQQPLGWIKLTIK